MDRRTFLRLSGVLASGPAILPRAAAALDFAGSVVRVKYDIAQGAIEAGVHRLVLNGPTTIAWNRPNYGLLSRFEQPQVEMVRSCCEGGQEWKWVRFHAIAVRSRGNELSEAKAAIGMDLEFFNSQGERIVYVRVANAYRFSCAMDIAPVTFQAPISRNIYVEATSMDFSASEGWWRSCG